MPGLKASTNAAAASATGMDCTDRRAPDGLHHSDIRGRCGDRPCCSRTARSRPDPGRAGRPGSRPPSRSGLGCCNPGWAGWRSHPARPVRGRRRPGSAPVRRSSRGTRSSRTCPAGTRLLLTVLVNEIAASIDPYVSRVGVGIGVPERIDPGHARLVVIHGVRRHGEPDGPGARVGPASPQRPSSRRPANCCCWCLRSRRRAVAHVESIGPITESPTSPVFSTTMV